jgi:putative transposase
MPHDETLSHTKWDCKYHVVFIPKCRRQALYKELRQHLGDGFRSLAEQKECRIEEGHLMPDHVHVQMAIPPKYSVAQSSALSKEKLLSGVFTCWGRAGAGTMPRKFH